MNRNAWWKWLILVVVISCSIALVYPPSQKIRLGLDLKGGMSFVVKIDDESLREEIKSRSPGKTDEEINAEVSKIMQGAQDRALEVLRNRMDGLGVENPVIFPGA